MNNRAENLIKGMLILVILVAFFVLGAIASNTIWRKTIIEKGHAEYQVNPKTGETKWVRKD